MGLTFAENPRSCCHSCWSLAFPAALLFAVTACNNTCFTFISNPPTGTIAVKASDPNPTCRLTTANGAVRVQVGTEPACSRCAAASALRVLLAQLKLELDHLEMRIDEADALIKKTARENEACQRLVAIHGIGPVTATAVIAAIGNGGAFHKGREFAAWMRIVPREHSTGGKTHR